MIRHLRQPTGALLQMLQEDEERGHDPTTPSNVIDLPTAATRPRPPQPPLELGGVDWFAEDAR